LRHRRFFSLAELNVAIRALLDELNDRPMRGWGASRRALFEQLDQSVLLYLARIVAHGRITRPRRFCALATHRRVKVDSRVDRFWTLRQWGFRRGTSLRGHDAEETRSLRSGLPTEA
jgi:hypothetical protein